MVRRCSRVSGGLAVIAALSVSLASCNGSDSESSSDGSGPFYDGQTVEIIVPVAPGGGADATARLFAEHLNERLDATFEVINIPGAGGLEGPNEFMLRREPDGTSLWLSGIANGFHEMLDHPNKEFTFSEVEPLVRVPYSAYVYASPDTGVETPEDLIDPPGPEGLRYVGRAPESFDVLHLLAQELLGIHDQVEKVWGYSGGGEYTLAFEQGEATIGMAQSGLYAQQQHLFDEGLATKLFAYGMTNAQGELERDPGEPDLPTIAEVYEKIHGEEPSGEVWDVFRAIYGGFQGSVTLWAHDDAPPAAIEELRNALEEASATPEWADGLEAAIGLPLEAITGDELLAHDPFETVTDEDVAWVLEWLGENYPDQVSDRG